MLETLFPMNRTAWVGFDMDECLGSFMPLWPFVELLPGDARMSNLQRQAYLEAVARRIAEQPLQLFRPGIPELVRKLRAAQRAGNITGCFILTNNGSKELAEVVRMALNHMATGSTNNTNNTNNSYNSYNSNKPNTNLPLFPVLWYRYSPCRQGARENPRKDWATIQACLAASGLPTLSHPSDLLFYDDQEHVLASEIPGYVRVPVYAVDTPPELVAHTLRPVFQQQGIATDVQQRVLQEAHTEARKERTSNMKNTAFPTMELDAFVQAMSRNGGTPRGTVGNAGNVGTRRTPRTIGGKSKGSHKQRPGTRRTPTLQKRKRAQKPKKLTRV